MIQSPVLPETPEEGQHGFALTPIQAGMIYETLAHHDASVNLEQVVLHLEDEPVDAVRMRAAWDRAIARHPALRLAFRQDSAGVLQQSAEAGCDTPLTIEDWTGVDDHAAALAERLRLDRARGVDLSHAPGWRLLWVQHGARHSTLIWTFSHAILDGRSFRAILEEVFDDYDAVPASQTRRDLPDFRDHCTQLAVQDKAPARAYFRDYLAGFDAPTPIGFATKPREAAVKAPNQTLSAHLSAAETAALMAQADQLGASFATMVQAAWGIVLARIAGRDDVVFGVTRSGRYLTPHSADMIGCLITTQPLRLTVGPDDRLRDLLARLRGDLHAQRPHEALGLPDIAAVTDIPNGTPLFDSLLMAERNSLHAALRAKGGVWQSRRVDLIEEGAVPLTLAAYGDMELLLRLEYMPGCISAEDAKRYLDYVMRLLRAMATAPPDLRICDLTMMPAAETAEIMALAQPSLPLDAPWPPCIATAFEAVAARLPLATALVALESGTETSFAALDQYANQLAHRLQGWGIGPGAVLGLCLPRSVEFVALVLAAAKIGAAFLPMDPSYPDDALQHMAEDSGAAMIFAQQSAPWMAHLPVTLIAPDGLAGLLAGQPVTAPDRKGLEPERAAYVIYTSGTTGKPKGVAVSQRSFAAHAAAAIAGYGLTDADRVLQFAALSFDVALEEIMPTLLAGARLVLRDDAMMTSPQAFAEAVSASEITVLNMPTGFWQVLLAGMEAGTARLPDCLRLMIVGGERMPPDALARWAALPDMPRLMNGYGPTETTITCAVFEAAGAIDGAEVPVGRSFGHALSYLLAPDGSLAPLGALGELWVGGDAVALGYLNQPALTAARFRPDPFTGQGRLYRSGDLAYWNADRQLVVTGRSDRQIKLRGFRIEPGEIEAVLEAIPGIAQAHVGLRPQGGGASARLIGWLRASDPGSVPDIASVRASLAESLPAPKRPDLIFVADWPQTPGGKTDVARLPAPARAAVAPRVDLVSDPQVTRIAEIFATVLGVGDVPGPEASFFDLGGHSLQLLTLIGHIEAAFSTRLTVAQVHAEPTPQGLAALLSGPVKLAPGADLFDCLMPIQPLGSGVPIYGVHVLGVNGSFFRPLAKAMGLDQPIFGLTVGLLSADTPTSVEATAALYFQAIQAHRPQGPVGLVAVSLGSYMALELAQQLTAAGREVRLLAMMDAAGPAGRGKIRGLAWFAAHLALLRKGGMGYARGLVLAKLDALRHRAERLRLRLGGRFSGDAPALKSVGGFVAANAVAIQNYTPRPYAGRMTIIRARASVFDSAQTIADGLGWKDVAQGGYDVVDVEGDHLSILEEPGVLDVASALTRAISRA